MFIYCDNVNDMKTCARCKLPQPRDNFTNCTSRKDGKNPYCKTCTRKASKAYTAKNPEKAKARGAAWYAANKERHAERGHKWFLDHPGKASEYCKRWRDTHPGENNRLSREWYAANREQALLSDKQSRERNLEKFLIRERESYAKRADRRKETGKEWRTKNKDRVAFHASKRRSALAQRTPEWLTDDDFEAMAAFFNEARRMTEALGVLHHVDHIIPLKGKTVSGLNVPWNLQVLSATENLKKSNRHAA